MIKIIDKYKPKTYGVKGGSEKILFELKKILSKIEKTEIINVEDKSSLLKPEFSYIKNAMNKITKNDILMCSSNNYFIFNKKNNKTILYLQDNLPLKLNLNGIIKPKIGFNIIGKYLIKNKYEKNKNKADLIIAISNYIKKQAKKEYRGKIIVVPNPVDTKKFKPVKQKQKYILFVGSLVKEKGIYTLIDAIKILRENNIMVPVQIIGSGQAWGKDNDKEIKKYAENIDRLKFLGQKNEKEVIKHMQTALIGVVPSEFGEPFGLTAIEFMSCGIPLVASRDGAIPENVIDGKTGLLFKKKDSKELAKNIIKLLKNKQLRNKISKNAREYTIQNFDKKPFEKRISYEIRKLINN